MSVIWLYLWRMLPWERSRIPILAALKANRNSIISEPQAVVPFSIKWANKKDKITTRCSWWPQGSSHHPPPSRNISRSRRLLAISSFSTLIQVVTKADLLSQKLPSSCRIRCIRRGRSRRLEFRIRGEIWLPTIVIIRTMGIWTQSSRETRVRAMQLPRNINRAVVGQRRRPSNRVMQQSWIIWLVRRLDLVEIHAAITMAMEWAIMHTCSAIHRVRSASYRQVRIQTAFAGSKCDKWQLASLKLYSSQVSEGKVRPRRGSRVEWGCVFRSGTTVRHNRRVIIMWAGIIMVASLVSRTSWTTLSLSTVEKWTWRIMLLENTITIAQGNNRSSVTQHLIITIRLIRLFVTLKEVNNLSTTLTVQWRVAVSTTTRRRI